MTSTPRRSDGIGERRLLYIDDDPLARTSFTALLRTLGYDVDDVPDAPSGLQRMSERGYALVITDMNMPGMSGLELTKSIKTLYPGTPVLVISGSITLDLDDSSPDGSPDCVLTKPMSFDELSGHLKRLLKTEATDGLPPHASPKHDA